jgi:hypothetical protein
MALSGRVGEPQTKQEDSLLLAEDCQALLPYFFQFNFSLMTHFLKRFLLWRHAACAIHASSLEFATE